MLSLFKTFFKRSFFALFCTQYLGSFNDNFFRTAMATFITYKITTISAGNKSVIVSLAVALFMLPYFLFSAMAGELAVPKKIIITEEIPLMGTGKVDYVKLKKIATGK